MFKPTPAFPFDTAKMVARYQAGGFTAAQAKALTYSLLEVVEVLRERAGAARIQQQEADYLAAQAQHTATVERRTQRLMRGYLGLLLALNVLVFCWP